MQEIQHIHFVGIGGSGMSPLARIFLDMGYKISGSDLKETEVTTVLRKKGAKIFIGHKEENVFGADMVVTSVAIPHSNEELVYAKRCDIPVLQRIEVLAMLMENKYGIAISGAHGKTTTTSMIAMAMDRCGFDPTVVIGGELNDIGGSSRLGKSKYLVAEADESSGQFLKLSPQVAVITNIDAEHLDYYGSIEGVRKAFKVFLRRLKGDGFTVACSDDPNVVQVIEDHKGKVITYGLGSDAFVRAVDIRKNSFTSWAKVTIDGNPWLELELNVTGIHNISNALAAIAVARELGADKSQLSEALAAFKGVHRRFELVGRKGGVTIIDDYAHHPTELLAALKSAKQTGAQRVIAIFQPHRYTRTRLLAEKFMKSFSDADVIIISEIFSAGEPSIPGVTAEGLVQGIVASGKKDVKYLPQMYDILDELECILRPGDLVITLGAGNIREVGEVLLDRL